MSQLCGMQKKLPIYVNYWIGSKIPFTYLLPSLAEALHTVRYAAPLEMNEGTPSGSEYSKPWAVVLKCPNAELNLYF
jgi:hypothetical protein